MQDEKLQYGLRSTGTGKLVRIEERTFQSEEYGLETDSYLTFDEKHPLLQLISLGSILFLKHGEKLHGRSSSEYYLERGMDIADFEVIEYTTRSNPSVPGDPSMYSVELSRLEFEMVEGVWYQFMDRKRSMAKQLETVFSKSEIAEMSDVPSLQFAVLKLDTVELARAGLSGKIIVPDYANRALANRQPMGVVDVRSVGGVTYAAISHEIGHPRFHRTISLVDGLNPHQDPWDDVKVAFDFNDTKTDDASDLLDEICEEDAFWPVGWSWVETFASSTHMMVIFRVEGAVRRDDGRAVRKLLNDIEAGIDPREARSETSSRKR